MSQQPKLTVIDGHPTTTSNHIADFFGKPHWVVLRAITDFLELAPEEFSRNNYVARTYQDSRGKTLPCYVLTRSGFAAIALAFTGQKAIAFRVAYITRFDEMEARLKERELSRIKTEYVKERYLPFGEPPVRDGVSIGTAIKHIRILKRLPELTAGKLKGMLKRGEIEGFQDQRGHWQIYDDQITKLLGGER